MYKRQTLQPKDSRLETQELNKTILARVLVLMNLGAQNVVGRK